MRDLLGGTKRKASFLGNHFMAICLGLLVLALVLSFLSGCATSSGSAGGSSSTASERATSTGAEASDGLRTVAYADLPKQARDTIELIDAGGPFPYPRDDGKTFGNFEGILPKQKRGYYKEYTVPTPGADTRGARRIVRGQDGTMYYTSDHYNSFRRIVR